MSKVFIAASMGLQNGLTSVWSAGAGRSTHLTGFLVDVSIVLAMFASACFTADLWRLKFVAPIFLCFMFGAFLGGLAFKDLGREALLVPALIQFASGLIVIFREPIFNFLLTVGKRYEFAGEPTGASKPDASNDSLSLVPGLPAGSAVQFGPTGQESETEKVELSVYNTI